MSETRHTVATLREALAEYDDDLLIMMPGDDEYDWMYLMTVHIADDIEFPENIDEDGEPSERRCVILEGE